MTTGAIAALLLASFTSTIAVMLTRPVHTGLSVEDGGPVLLAGRTGNKVVRTGMALESVRLAELPSLAVSSGQMATYDRIRNVHYAAYEPAGSNTSNIVAARASSQPDSVQWFSSTRMTITLKDGTKVLLDNGSVEFRLKPSTRLSFDASGDAAAAGALAVLATTGNHTSPTVAAKCAAAACPLSQCSALLSYVAGFAEPSEVQCGGMPVWAWPSGVSLDPPPAARAARRRLGDCLAEANAVSAAYDRLNSAEFGTRACLLYTSPSPRDS